VRVEQVVLEEQRGLLAEELRITSQRVNLFEKVMIPRTEENIRVIQIALGDAQTAGVVRAKIAKSKGQELVSGATG
jgi:V/A-type H+-transporting ATPase subunit D